ncbi:MAG: nucleotidyltransferase domain-containing protein [Candidatus Nanohaloarchaea archaeon]|nr:nucleotidyltransferase domain-containing protein [Candidatus Nanohaloarchaea archaeon]
MLLKEKSKVLEPFTRMPWKGLTFGEVKEISGKSSDNYVHSTLKEAVSEGILVEEKAGNVILYSPARNSWSNTVLGFVAEYRTHNMEHIPHQELKRVMDEIDTPFYSLVVTGSYARGEQSADSDLDIVVLCGEDRSPESIMAEIRFESEMSVPEIHPYVFTRSQMVEMLINDEENYGKETVRNFLVVTGGKQFYKVVLEAVDNGFQG